MGKKLHQCDPLCDQAWRRARFLADELGEALAAHASGDALDVGRIARTWAAWRGLTEREVQRGQLLRDVRFAAGAVRDHKWTIDEAATWVMSRTPMPRDRAARTDCAAVVEAFVRPRRRWPAGAGPWSLASNLVHAMFGERIAPEALRVEASKSASVNRSRMAEHAAKTLDMLDELQRELQRGVVRRAQRP